MTTIINGSSPSITFSDGSAQTSATRPFLNRIINGAMVISQRGTSPTITGGGDYSIDRFYNYYSGPVYTSVQSTTAPAGFTNSLKLTVTTPSASPTYSFFGQKIEGYNVADLNWGTANAKTVTISFWVYASVSGVYSFSLTNGDGNRAYPQTYTISATNTWQQITATITGDTTGTWASDNSTGINIRFNMGSGSARLGTSGSWQAGNYDGATGSTGASTWANTNGATFYITGVQLEVGSTATSFDYVDYGRSLIQCQRYFQVYPVSATGWVMQYFSSAACYGAIRLKVTMRTAPSLTVNNVGGYAVYSNGTGRTATAISSDGTTTDTVSIGVTASGATAGDAAAMNGNSSASMFFSAEL